MTLCESFVFQDGGARTACPFTTLTSISDKIARALLQLSHVCLQEISIKVITDTTGT